VNVPATSLSVPRIVKQDLMIVPDCNKRNDSKTNPLVAPLPKTGLYAGMTLITRTSCAVHAVVSVTEAAQS